MGKSSIKRMNAAQETEEKKEASAEKPAVEIDTEAKKPESEKRAAAGKKKAASMQNPDGGETMSPAKKRMPRKKTGSAGKQELAENTADQKAEAKAQAEDACAKKQESGVVSNITCELPIYLM